MIQLIRHLNSVHPLSEKLTEHLLRVLQKQTFSKKSFLLQAGQVCKHIYFIETGLVRCFYPKRGSEICTWFMKEGDVIISVESFFLQKQSYEYIQALEETVVYGISYSELQFIYQHFPEFNVVGRVLTERYYVLSEERSYSLRMQTSQSRYESLLLQHPVFFQRVPLKYIASYLGMQPETLSRLRSSVR